MKDSSSGDCAASRATAQRRERLAFAYDTVGRNRVADQPKILTTPFKQGVVERGDEGGHDHDRGQDDDGVGAELSAVGPVDLPQLLADVLQELPETGALPLLFYVGEALLFHTATLACSLRYVSHEQAEESSGKEEIRAPSTPTEGIEMMTRGRSTYRMTPSRWIVIFLVVMLVSSAAIALLGTVLAPN